MERCDRQATRFESGWRKTFAPLFSPPPPNRVMLVANSRGTMYVIDVRNFVLCFCFLLARVLLHPLSSVGRLGTRCSREQIAGDVSEIFSFLAMGRAQIVYNGNWTQGKCTVVVFFVSTHTHTETKNQFFLLNFGFEFGFSTKTDFSFSCLF